MAGINCRSPSGWSSGDELATFLNISDKITKSDNQYYEAGAFSDVFKCQYHNGVGLVEVAVKSFRFPFSLGEIRSDKDDSRNDRDQKSIRRELGIWRRLKHPNIVPFLGVAYGFGRPGQASLVSLWMVNGSLQSFLGQHGDQLTIAHRLQLLLDIANGLCYLHSFAPTPIIHGDLSSHNVLLDRNYNARLTDFGYTSMIGDMPEASLYLQMTTMKPGALRWAVPEHLLVGEEQTLQPTTQSDIYSFGNLGLLVLSGKQPWSEIQREPAVIVRLSQGLRPKRPSSTPIEDQYWELIEHCWSSVSERPGAGDVVSSLQQFLRPYLPPLPLADIFRAPSRSSHPAVHYITILEPNYPPGLSPATLDHQNGVFRDDFTNAVITHDIQQKTGTRERDQEVVASTPEEPNPALRNSSAGTVSDDALRTNKEEPSSTVFIVRDENYRVVGEQQVQGLDDTTARRQSGEIRLDLPANPQSGDKLNKRYSRDVATSKDDVGHSQSLTRPRTRNVIFIGETGSGKSSIINLFADRDHAAVSNDSGPCTTHFVSSEVTVEGRTYRLWDTPGFNQATNLGLLRRFTHPSGSPLSRFLRDRYSCGELDLLVLCVAGNRGHAGMSRVYKLLCRETRRTTPVVIAVTHLEKSQPTMDAWWQNNEKELASRGMLFDGHACLTCLLPHRLRGASQQAIRRLISNEYQRPAKGEGCLNDPGSSCMIC